MKTQIIPIWAFDNQTQIKLLVFHIYLILLLLVNEICQLDKTIFPLQILSFNSFYADWLVPHKPSDKQSP